MNRLLAVDKPPTCAGEWVMPPGGTSRPFEARFGGRCAAECGQPIREGDTVVYEDDELIHEDCAGKPEPTAKPTCPSCWTVHAGECM